MTENERPLIEVARETRAHGTDMTMRQMLHSSDYALCFIAGYEQAQTDGHAKAKMRARIAELEADVEQDQKNLNWWIARASDLETKLRARSTAQGIGVDDAMLAAFVRSFWGPAPGVTVAAKDAARKALTAALRTARTVPLESVDTIWVDDMQKAPFYRGIVEVRDE